MRGESFILRLMNGLRKPKHKILGDDIAGEVEAVGKNVKQFQPGDEVFGVSNFGAFTEYGCSNEEYLVRKPATLSFEEAAAIPMAAIPALQGLRDKGQIQSGQKVLINGASGGVGTYAVQLAKNLEAEVTGVCSTTNLEMVKSLGADHVIDYKKSDFTQNGEQYDVILDAVIKTSYSHCKSSLKERGVFISAGWPLLQALRSSMVGSKKVKIGIAPNRTEDLIFLTELIEAGKVKAVIDRCYPLEQTAEAHMYVDSGRKKGNVVITVID